MSEKDRQKKDGQRKDKKNQAAQTKRRAKGKARPKAKRR